MLSSSVLRFALLHSAKQILLSSHNFSPFFFSFLSFPLLHSRPLPCPPLSPLLSSSLLPSPSLPLSPPLLLLSPPTRQMDKVHADHVLTFMDREIQSMARKLSVYGYQTETKEEKMVCDYVIYNIVFFRSLSFFFFLTIFSFLLLIGSAKLSLQL